MKWRVIHPAPGTYAFGPADEVAQFAREHHQGLRGHTLLWHGSLPTWVTDKVGAPCSQMQAILKDHITAVVTRYRDVVTEWDVANEVVDGNGKLRRDNPFLASCGEGIIADAFRWTEALDPDAVLILNDYDIEGPGPKADAVRALVQRLRALGAPVQAVGLQSHLTAGTGLPPGTPENVGRFAALGVSVAITEADVRVDTLFGRPLDGELDRQTTVYADLMRVCLDQPACRSFTVWGLTDDHSWVGDQYFFQGAATLYDRHSRPKPAYWRLSQMLRAR